MSTQKNGKLSPTEHSASLRRIGRKSALSALRENKALGLPVTYMNKGRVIKEHPDGQKVVIGRITNWSGNVGVSKGDVIRAKKS